MAVLRACGAGSQGLGLGRKCIATAWGDYLVVSIDLPVVSRVTEASAEAPHLGLGMAIAPERLKKSWAHQRAEIRDHASRNARCRSQQASVGSSRCAVRLYDFLIDLRIIPALPSLIEQEIL